MREVLYNKRFAVCYHSARFSLTPIHSNLSPTGILMTRAIASFATLVSLALALGLAAHAQDASAPAPQAKGPDVAKGQAVASQVCAACHAPDGNAIGNAYPKLAAQHADYLVKELVN